MASNTNQTSLVRRGRVARVLLIAAAGVGAGGLGGCVSQQKYDETVGEVRSLTSRNEELAARIRELEQTAGALRDNTTGARSAMQQLQDENATLRQELASARSAITRLEEQLGGLAFERLDPATDAALADLARQFPGIVTYDPDRGMLRFASDLTFDSGSDAVKDSAKSSLQALARVLRTPEAGQYDVRIVGHTDSQRISARTAQRHPTNTHLSAHRAIAVRQELSGLGVPVERMEVSGWGEYRPIAPNGSNGNTPENRRVEIFLVPSTIGSARPSGAPTGVNPPGVPVDRQRLDGTRFEPTK